MGPAPPHRALTRAGEAIDRAFLRLILGGPVVRRRTLRDMPEGEDGHAVIERLEQAIQFFDGLGDQLFPEPARIHPTLHPAGSLEGGEVHDLTWPSGWAPLHADYEQILQRAPRALHTSVRWLRHHRPAPAVICVHGWGGGHLLLETRAWRARRLYRRGLDVLLFTLPFHAARMANDRRTPLFPHPDPFRSNEPLAQAVYELRSLVGYLRGRGAPAVGIAGMSLGGYTAALTATAESELDFVLPIIPVASVSDLMWNLGAATLTRAQAQALGLTEGRFAEAFSATCPLARLPRVPGDRVMVLPGASDRVVPAHHAQLLADHFRAPLRPFPGCHLLQLGRGELFRSIEDWLVEAGHLR